MTATALSAELVAKRTRPLRRPRLVNAELLKLRKRRGLVASCFALTVLPMVVAYIVLLGIHAANPAKHGPAGGIENLSGSLDLLTTLSGVAAILIGATLGAGDLSSGVFRELVVTGRLRRSSSRRACARLDRRGVRLCCHRCLFACFRRNAGGPQRNAPPGHGGMARARQRALPRVGARGVFADGLPRNDDRRRARLAGGRGPGAASDQGVGSPS
jgi:hypothetical protein